VQRQHEIIAATTANDLMLIGLIQSHPAASQPDNDGSNKHSGAGDET